MSETPNTATTEDTGEDPRIRVQIVVNDRAEAFIFHSRPFRKRLSWIEYDMDNQRLDFIMNDGDIRNFGIPVDPKYGKYLQNSFQVLLVRMDDKTGEPLEGSYFPLIIHKA